MSAATWQVRFFSVGISGLAPKVKLTRPRLVATAAEQKNSFSSLLNLYR